MGKLQLTSGISENNCGQKGKLAHKQGDWEQALKTRGTHARVLIPLFICASEPSSALSQSLHLLMVFDRGNKTKRATRGAIKGERREDGKAC